MGKSKIYILGVGNNTPVFIDLVQECGFDPVGLYHYNDTMTGKSLLGIPVIGSTKNLLKESSLEGKLFAISIGDNFIRKNISDNIRKLGGSIPNLIHPSSVVSIYADLGEGIVIHANAVVQATSKIGNDSVVSFGASITHTTIIGEACYIAANAQVGAYVKIEDFVLIGQGAVIVSAKVKKIGEKSIVGAGAVVTKPVETNSKVAGNPAIVLRETKVNK